MDQQARDILREAPDDTLARTLLDLKEQAAELRQTIWTFEDELRDRLINRNATVILAENYRVKSSVKREVEWDQVALVNAERVAKDEWRSDEFHKAFPLKRECSVRNLNALLKLGGETAKAIEAARGEVKEKISIVVEALSSGSAR